MHQVCLDWVGYLKEVKLYGYNAPLFPRTALQSTSEFSFQAVGLEPEHWSTTTPARKIFREAFEAAGLPYYNPHSFRHTLGHLMSKYCKNMEEIQVWSLNLGHETPLVTYASYNHMSPHRQGEILKGLKRV